MHSPSQARSPKACMMLGGVNVANSIYREVSDELDKIKARGAVIPRLAVVVVGNTEEALQYASMKTRKCNEIGLRHQTHALPQDTSQHELNCLLDTLSEDEDVHGILLQLPLPGHLNSYEAQTHLAPQKDVDGLTKTGVGNLVLHGRESPLLPCTARACMDILEFYKVPIVGRKTVVLGRSALAGRPIALLMDLIGATVTVVHKLTPIELRKKEQASADIVIVAVGICGFVTASQLKPGCTVIDVGIHKFGDFVQGDVDPAGLTDVCAHITPVPGGVGPVTVSNLLRNTVRAYLLSEQGFPA